ncbi:MAG: pyruvate:ferredoxin (flavodoxin) oxidoreductase [Candidatus Kapabacteria bacterium]|jgi:pyruvate-ferredoxin/flavodoxin oxidoreductase|nr:pyruvate:ferredoxin (flavodoxin) oxidoreductase [Candidatus Kapabacteria bacterium]
MTKKVFATIDGNEAAAYVAYRCNEVCAIYPITPSSNMGEWADEWAAKGIKNLWGNVPEVVEMQSEGGAAGALHGSLQAGALTTTFTASQGLLLKMPNMFKIAGELTPTVFNISARTLATHALSIFGDHSDVMAARTTGFAMTAAASVQETMDLGLIAHASTLESRIPFIAFFDGFRTSHEVAKIELVSEDVMREMICDDLVADHRVRSLSPDHPVLRGTAQNPDVFFQNRETVNKFYDACPDIIQKNMDKFAKLTGRKYELFQYEGDANPDRVIVLMASGIEPVGETIEYLRAKGEKVGVIKVRVYRPFDIKRFMEAIPASTKAIAVLDRTKEPGATGEPLYMDCVTALHEGMNNGWGSLKAMPTIVGGRYGLSSKEFTASMVKAVFENLSQDKPKNHFTIGINDDVTFTSLDFDPKFSLESDSVVRALFYGLGSDGTVGANKNSIKIIGENTDNYAQGYFVYDSKKAGSLTVSHLRFGPNPIRSTYLVNSANFIACHQTVFIETYDMLKDIVKGGTFLLNTPFSKEDAWSKLPKTVQQQILDNEVKFYVIDAQKVAEESGMGRRINTVMQVCFFAISGVLPKDESIAAIKDSIKKTYGRKGDKVVNMNLKAVDNTLENLFQVDVPTAINATYDIKEGVSDKAPTFVKDVLSEIMSYRGEDLPVSVFPSDGTFPTGTTKYEKRNIALQIPVWNPEICIQCSKCAFVCPHACIRPKIADDDMLKDAPASFKSIAAKDKAWAGKNYVLQVAPEDCTGCGVCVEICPAKDKKVEGRKSINMEPQMPLREQEVANWDFFTEIPEMDRNLLTLSKIQHQQLLTPLFEFSGACAGCGETPYIKLMSQLFGDRSIVANATGCSSIYGGNLPTTPWTKDANGRGPAWSNSLFEDNAEFGLGFRLAADKQNEIALDLIVRMKDQIGAELVDSLCNADQSDEQGLDAQRGRVTELKSIVAGIDSKEAKRLLTVADYLVKKSIWIIGGDGWAYDIGYGGLDHVLATGKNVNVLVVDTEVYSNTGGQASKSTPLSAVAKFASNGMPTKKKDLGRMMMAYGNIYVAVVAMGYNDMQTAKTFREAEAFDGPSIIIAYSHCIAHGINMDAPYIQQKLAVESGQWILYRFNPDLLKEGKNPLTLDSKAPKRPVAEFLDSEARFTMLKKIDPELAAANYIQAQKDADERYADFKFMADRKYGDAE